MNEVSQSLQSHMVHSKDSADGPGGRKEEELSGFKKNIFDQQIAETVDMGSVDTGQYSSFS